MALAYGSTPVEAIVFDLDDTLVPVLSPRAWQWAWRPQGPLIGERRVRAAVRRALRTWDHRRWAGLTGRLPPADPAALHDHLASTLAGVAGRALPDEESEAVVRRILQPRGDVERYDDAAPALARLAALGVRVAVATPFPEESARWLLRRVGLAESLLVVAGEAARPSLPDPEAFRTAVEAVGSVPERVVFVGDLFWSDARAAHRAGLPAILLDRHDLWPRVTTGRISSLAELERAVAAGPASEEPREEPAGPGAPDDEA